MFFGVEVVGFWFYFVDEFVNWFVDFVVVEDVFIVVKGVFGGYEVFYDVCVFVVMGVVEVEYVCYVLVGVVSDFWVSVDFF